MNIIEAVRDHLDRERNKHPKSKELWEMLKEVWYNTPEDYFKKPRENLPKRVQDGLSAERSH